MSPTQYKKRRVTHSGLKNVISVKVAVTSRCFAFFTAQMKTVLPHIQSTFVTAYILMSIGLSYQPTYIFCSMRQKGELHNFLSVLYLLQAHNLLLIYNILHSVGLSYPGINFVISIKPY